MQYKSQSISDQHFPIHTTYDLDIIIPKAGPMRNKEATDFTENSCSWWEWECKLSCVTW